MCLLVALQFIRSSLLAANVPHDNALIKAAREEELLFGTPSQRPHATGVRLQARDHRTTVVIQLEHQNFSRVSRHKCVLRWRIESTFLLRNFWPIWKKLINLFLPTIYINSDKSLSFYSALATRNSRAWTNGLWSLRGGSTVKMSAGDDTAIKFLSACQTLRHKSPREPSLRFRKRILKSSEPGFTRVAAQSAWSLRAVKLEGLIVADTQHPLIGQAEHDARYMGLMSQEVPCQRDLVVVIPEQELLQTK